MCANVKSGIYKGHSVSYMSIIANNTAVNHTILAVMFILALSASSATRKLTIILCHCLHLDNNDVTE